MFHEVRPSEIELLLVDHRRDGCLRTSFDDVSGSMRESFDRLFRNTSHLDNIFLGARKRRLRRARGRGCSDTIIESKCLMISC